MNQFDDDTITKAAQYAAILVELRHQKGIYDKNLRDMALAVSAAGGDDAIVWIAEHYQKTIFVYASAIQDMAQQFNEVMQLDFPEMEGAE